ncbi:MAG: 50S ribosomal protein L11 methyltransferase [Anaerolineaceae bacterium]|nr:50S ribosomal protein L11 methyltransferase [Anaerolineaceae bacterium]
MVEDISWLEVKIICDGEIAESVSEILSRYVTQGVVTETDAIYDDAEEILLETGEIRVFGYLINDETVEEKRQKIEEGLWHLSIIKPIPQPTYQIIHNEDWMESWKKYYNPIKIGKRLLILPAWLENPYPERVAIKIDPSMAFGTGTHPTTQLCMLLTEEVMKQNTNVIDVGCGSGILSITVLKLGAKRALGVDLDYPSIVATKKNAEINQVQEKIEVGTGSVTEILAGTFSIKRAELVMVNILAPIIIRLFDNGLSKLIKENGYLILSGILDHQSNEVIEKAENTGLQLIKKEMINDWVGMTFKK